MVIENRTKTSTRKRRLDEGRRKNSAAERKTIAAGRMRKTRIGAGGRRRKKRIDVGMRLKRSIAAGGRRSGPRRRSGSRKKMTGTTTS
jgi:hypothetical protein